MTLQALNVPDLVDKEAVLADIRARSDTFQQLRHIPQDVINQFKTLGV